jgi:DNA-binding CsgD family transcriptional regulator
MGKDFYTRSGTRSIFVEIMAAATQQTTTSDIMEKGILSLYEEVFPLLYDNPENVDVYHRFSNLLGKIVPFYSSHYFMLDPKGDLDESFGLSYEKWLETDSRKDFTDIGVKVFADRDSDKKLDALIEKNYDEMVKQLREKFPEEPEYHYHRIESRKIPQAAMGFFRRKDPTRDNSFTASELHRFDELSPHIFIVLRTILTYAIQSRSFQLFDTYTEICSKIGHDYRLTDTESKFLPEILFGYSNEKIAERNFVSSATVKKHLKSIFKKTGTKNRMDFVGKFFTSPERVNL